MRKPLIETNSPLYLRRMAREINSFNGEVYYKAYQGCASVRVRDARYSNGVLYIRTYQQGDPFEPWTPVTDVNAFIDGYCEQVVASREK